MAKIIGILGFIGSGKGTVARHLVKHHGFKQDSFAASLKDACSAIFGWPRDMIEGESPESRIWRETEDTWWAEQLNIPHFSPRLALQLIGTNTLRDHFNPNLWFLTIQNRIRQSPEQDIVISDVRFPNEINFVRQMGGALMWVNRGPLPTWYDTALSANNGHSIAKEIMMQSYSKVHYSEWAGIGEEVEYRIDNNGTISDLEIQISEIIKNLP